jgi:hypothetical protein
LYGRCFRWECWWARESQGSPSHVSQSAVVVQLSLLCQLRRCRNKYLSGGARFSACLAVWSAPCLWHAYVHRVYEAQHARYAGMVWPRGAVWCLLSCVCLLLGVCLLLVGLSLQQTLCSSPYRSCCCCHSDMFRRASRPRLPRCRLLLAAAVACGNGVGMLSAVASCCSLSAADDVPFGTRVVRGCLLTF